MSVCLCVCLMLCLAPHELKNLCTCRHAAFTQLAVNPCQVHALLTTQGTLVHRKYYWCGTHTHARTHARTHTHTHTAGRKKCVATSARLEHTFGSLPCSLISFTIPSLMALATPSPAHFKNQLMSADARQAPCGSIHLLCSYIAAAAVLQDRVDQGVHVGWAQAAATPVQTA